jgi:hypothetical protein
MSTEIQKSTPPKAAAPSDSRATFLVLVSAMLIGMTGGLLVADREASVGRNATAATKSVGGPAGQPSKDDSAASKSADANEKEPAKEPAPAPPKSVSPAVETVNYSEQTDSASVSIALGSVALVGTDKAHNPERIYFDLRDSHRLEAPVDGFRAMKAVRTDGTLVGRVRVAKWESGAIRIVLDLKRPCEYKYEITSEPYPRLVVRLQPRTTGEIVAN